MRYFQLLAGGAAKDIFKTVRHLVSLTVLMLLLFTGVASAADHSQMRAAVTLLESAKESLRKPRTALDPPEKSDPLPLLLAAKRAVEEAPPIYLGRKKPILESIDLAIAEVRTGDRARKAREHIDHAAKIIRNGVQEFK